MKSRNFLVVVLSATVAATVFLCSGKASAQENFGGNGPGNGPGRRNIPSGSGMQPGGMPGGQGMGGGNENREGGGMPFGSSKEAKEACDGKSENDSCSFTVKKPGSDEETTMDGTCVKTPARNGDSSSSDTLSCVPEKKDGENSGESRLERAKEMKKKKTEEISKIESRTGKLISFLKSEGLDEDTLEDIEGYLDTFKEKADALLSEIDDYIGILEDDDSDDDDKKSAMESVKTAGQEMMDYFNNTLRKNIKEALDSLND